MIFDQSKLNVPMLYAGLGLLSGGYDRRVNPWQSAMRGFAAGQQQLQNQQQLDLYKKRMALLEAKEARDLAEFERLEGERDAYQTWYGNLLTPIEAQEGPPTPEEFGMLAARDAPAKVQADALAQYRSAPERRQQMRENQWAVEDRAREAALRDALKQWRADGADPSVLPSLMAEYGNTDLITKQGTNAKRIWDQHVESLYQEGLRTGDMSRWQRALISQRSPHYYDLDQPTARDYGVPLPTPNPNTAQAVTPASQAAVTPASPAAVTAPASNTAASTAGGPTPDPGTQPVSASPSVLVSVDEAADAKRRMEARENLSKTQRLASREVAKADQMLATIDQIIPEVDFTTAGLLGSTLARFPGTDARDLRNLADEVRANLSFNALNEMRQASPTGGALGNVTEMELNLLGQAEGSLGQDQSPEQLEQNLKKIRDSVRRWRQAVVENLYSQVMAASGDVSAPPGRKRYNPSTQRIEDVAGYGQ